MPTTAPVTPSHAPTFRLGLRRAAVALPVLLLLAPVLPVEATLPGPAATVQQAYCTLLLHTMVNDETVSQCIESLMAGDPDESSGGGGCSSFGFGPTIEATGDVAVLFTPLLAINSPWDGYGIRTSETKETAEYNVGFEFGPVEAGIDLAKTDVSTTTIQGVNGETVVFYQEIEWSRFTLYRWEAAWPAPECKAYEFWAPTNYEPSGGPSTKEWELSDGTSAFTDADNDLLPTADIDYVTYGSPPIMSLDIRYKTKEGDHCAHTGGGFTIGTENAWRGEVSFDFGGGVQGGTAYGHSESDNWEYKFTDDGNCYYYDFLGVDEKAKAGVAFHTVYSPDFAACDSSGQQCCDNGGTWANHCCEPQTWDGSEGRCCDPTNEDDHDCQDTVSEHCSPHVVNTCESLEETLTEAVAAFGATINCADLEAGVTGLEDNVPIGSPNLCESSKGSLPWVQVCDIHFGDPDGEPLVFEDPVLCDLPSPCAMFDHPDLCERPDPCENTVLENKVECGVPGLCDGGDVEGAGDCGLNAPSRSIPALIVCGNVVFAGRGDSGGAIVIDNEAVCPSDDE